MKQVENFISGHGLVAFSFINSIISLANFQFVEAPSNVIDATSKFEFFALSKHSFRKIFKH